MAWQKITGTHVTTVEIDGTGEQWIVTKGAVLQPPPGTSTTALEESGIGNHIKIYGHIAAEWTAVLSSGVNTIIDVKDGALITGTISTYGAGAEIINHGRIRATDDGDVAISSDEYGFELRNYKKITSEDQAAMNINDAGAVIVNEKGAVISGLWGVRILTAENEGTVRVTNHGLIQGEHLSVGDGYGDDIIRNDGKLIGDVELSTGDDRFDNRGGKVVGDILGGLGDDIFTFDNASDVAVELDGQGEDIVRASVSYKLDPDQFIERLELIGNKNINATGNANSYEIWGNSGDNILTCKGEFRYLDGRAGDDLLKGGDGTDRFYFRTGYDHDTARNFDQGPDLIAIGGWNAIDDFGDVKSHAKNKGDDVVIKAGNDSLTIEGLHKADLNESDFRF